MSASERLRALDAPMLMGDPELTYAENARRSFEATLALRNALPEIVAVVEAAERLDALDADGNVITTIGPATDAIENLGPALAALEEKLSQP